MATTTQSISLLKQQPQLYLHQNLVCFLYNKHQPSTKVPVDQCTSPGHHFSEGTETRAVFTFLAQHGGSTKQGRNAATVKRSAEKRAALFPVYTNGHVCGGLHVRDVTAMFVHGQCACLIRSVARLHVILSTLLYGASAVCYVLWFHW